MPPTAIKWWFAFLIVMMAVTAFATAAENENTQLRRSLEHERARLANLASRDDLTGLRNGRWLRNQLHSLADSGEEVRCALFYIDLDGFKQINDTYGHGAGDAVLCHVSDKLTERCGGEFLPARVGGDEFIIFAEHAMNRIEREAFSDTLQSALLEPFEVDELRLTIGASIGHACIPDDAENPRQLIAIADQAMYAAKLRRRAGEMAREISGQSEEEADQGMKKAG